MPPRASPANSMSPAEEESMGQATRCVRKFAPGGKKKMGRRESRHITACKISDANPNELIVSWSGDHIYSFDIVKSPDVNDSPSSKEETDGTRSGKVKAKESTERKRKRRKEESSTSLDERREPKSKPPEDSSGRNEMAVRSVHPRIYSTSIVALAASESPFREPLSCFTTVQREGTLQISANEQN